MRGRLAICVIALCAATASSGSGRSAAGGEAGLSTTGDARVAVHIDGTGRLSDRGFGGHRLGLRWPGAAGSEFLGSCGFILRFENGARQAHVVLEQGSLRPEPPAGFAEDDGAADGRFKLVTRAVSRANHLSISQSHYHWSFGHVRDFLAFSTSIEYTPPRGTTRPLRGFEAALVSDFRIGDPHDESRADNDRFRYLWEDSGGSCLRGGAAVATAREPGGPLVAVVIFSARGPGEEPLETKSLIVPAGAGPDFPWEAEELARAPRPGSEGDGGRGAAAPGEELGGGLCASAEFTGNLAIVHRIGGLAELAPGQSVVVEWALVFGRDPAALMRGVARARETWEGRRGPGGELVRWVVPARKAQRIEVRAALSPVWVQGERRAAALVSLEEDSAEEVEWLAVAGERVERFEQVGERVVTVIDAALVEGGETFDLEGQLADGTIFTASITKDDLGRFSGGGELAPGRLPEESLRLFPNPFVAGTTIHVSIQDPAVFTRDGAAWPGSGSVRVYDVKGRLVRSILDEELRPGDYSLEWDGTDEAGTAVSPGVYYCKLQIGERSLTKRVILLR